MGTLSAFSQILSPRVAARIGLIRTMVYTHLPANIFLILAGVMPTASLSILFLLLRMAVSQMDVPARQAYLAAIAGPAHRSEAAAVTNAVRTSARPFGAPLAAAAVGTSISGLPFFISGGLKALYDVAVFVWFRRIPLPDLEPSRDDAEPVE